MGKTLSGYLRSRVIAAVDGGLSRRAAAERFEVSVATAICWVRTFRATGVRSARARGGDQRSHRIEAYRNVLLGAVTARVDITLAELSDLLWREHGAKGVDGAPQRFETLKDVTLNVAVWPEAEWQFWVIAGTKADLTHARTSCSVSQPELEAPRG